MELNAGNTAIVLDSTADFPEAPGRFSNWRVVPLYVRFGDESFRDYVELGPDRFYARLREAAELPTTSQPTPGDFAATYEELGGYARIFSIHVASRLSGTFESARTAADLDGGSRVRTIDEEVDDLVERYRREAGLRFTVDTLEFLQRGGRIGRAQAMAGNLLNVKPILTIRDGEVVPLKRVRGWKKALLEFEHDFAESSQDVPGLRVGIAHAEAPERADELAEAVRRLRPGAEIELVTTLGAVVGTHAGPGTIGFFWFSDPEGA